MHNLSSFENRSNLSASPLIPWTPKDVAWALVISVIIIALFGLGGNLVGRAGTPLDPSLVVNLGTLILLGPIWYFTLHKYNTGWTTLGLRSFRPAIIALGFGLLFVFMLFNALYATVLQQFGQRIQPDLAPIFDESIFPIALFIGGAVVAPVVEEIFFRGFVFAGLRPRWGWKKAMLVSAGLFALAHVLLTSLLPIFILGLIFAYLYQISGSIWPAIIMHMFINTLTLSIVYALSQGWLPMP